MSSPCRRVFPDLGAVVHLDDVPAELLDELPGLYSSAFSTAEYFAIYDGPRRVSACELSEPRHVIVFTSHGATADVLNKVIDIAPTEVERVASAIFRARPEIRRLRAELKFAPRELGLPARELYRQDNQVVELPGSVEAWERRLGAPTRRHLRAYRNRLRRKHPDFDLRTLEGAQITQELVERAFAWNRESVRAKGGGWFYDDQPEAAHKLWRLVQSRGVALCGYAGGECVSVSMSMVVGRDCWGLLGGFDAAYADAHLGFLMTSLTVAESISRGCARLQMSWGDAAYKQHLGAAPVAAYRASIYRSRLDRALYARERVSLHVWDRRDVYYFSRRPAVDDRRTVVGRFVDDLVLPRHGARRDVVAAAATWLRAVCARAVRQAREPSRS